jgi:GT2 family glycosyltransferase
MHLRGLADQNIDVVSFLDDDVIPVSNYFNSCRDLFKNNLDAVCIGGYDVSIAPSRKSRMGRWVGLIPKHPGTIAKSGLTSVAVPDSDLSPAEWVPGGMQNFRWSVLRHCLFDGRMAFFGEDVEMHLRMRKYGLIFSSSRLKVEHLGYQGAKPSIVEQKLCESTFRWWLASQYPDMVSKPMVVLGSLALAAQSILGRGSGGLHSRILGARAEFIFLSQITIGQNNL